MLEKLSAKDLAELTRIGQELTFPTGTVIARAGDETGYMYYITSGSVEIRKSVGNAKESVESLEPGDFFGGVASGEGQKNITSAVAIAPTSIIRSSGKEMEELVFQNPPLARAMAHSYSRRIDALSDIAEKEFESQRLAWEQEISRLNLIIKAAQAVNTSLKLERVLELILNEALQATGATRGTIYLVDDITNEIVSHIIVGDELTEIRQPIGQGISGYVARTGETVCIDDAYQDHRFNPEFDRASGFKTKNILCVAMKNKTGKIVGVFQLINKMQENFTKDDERFLKAISIHASIAIENSQLLLQMVKSERLSAIGRMAGAIIHDIKNPMTTIRLYAQVLKKQVTNREAGDLVDEITRQIDRLVRIAEEVLDFSRDTPTLNFQRVNFNEFISGIILFLRKDFERRNIRIINEAEYEGEIDLDVDRLTRVVLNVATNAADAMSSGGDFIFRTRSMDDSLVIEMADTGPGMPEEIKKRIFEPFVTYGKRHGTGLGMAIVKRIVDEHKGDVKVLSKTGKGTRIIIRLPLVHPK